MPITPKSIPGKTETFLRAAPRARLGKLSSGQPSPGPFQPNLGMSPGVPQFDPEFETHLFLHFSACRLHPNQFPVKTETFLRAASRVGLGKISSGKPSPGPFQPNLGMSPGVPQFDPEFQTHLFLHVSAYRFHPNRFPVKTETFLCPVPRARLGKISSGQPSPGPFQPNLGTSWSRNLMPHRKLTQSYRTGPGAGIADAQKRCRKGRKGKCVLFLFRKQNQYFNHLNQ